MPAKSPASTNQSESPSKLLALMLFGGVAPRLYSEAPSRAWNESYVAFLARLQDDRGLASLKPTSTTLASLSTALSLLGADSPGKRVFRRRGTADYGMLLPGVMTTPKIPSKEQLDVSMVERAASWSDDTIAAGCDGDPKCIEQAAVVREFCHRLFDEPPEINASTQEKSSNEMWDFLSAIGV